MLFYPDGRADEAEPARPARARETPDARHGARRV
jgi:hypothetical protein